VGLKSRENFRMRICLKECANQGKAACDSCIRFSKLKPTTKPGKDESGIKVSKILNRLSI
jgi:hypothetical protein